MPAQAPRHNMRIARWARIGMAISAAWIGCALTALTYADIRVARFLRYAAFEVCDYVNHYVCHCGNCWRDVMNVAAFVDQPLMNLALIALAPIVFAWLCAYAALRNSHSIARWST
jgi:hypothetical protein